MCKVFLVSAARARLSIISGQRYDCIVRQGHFASLGTFQGVALHCALRGRAHGAAEPTVRLPSAGAGADTASASAAALLIAWRKFAAAVATPAPESGLSTADWNGNGGDGEVGVVSSCSARSCSILRSPESAECRVLSLSTECVEAGDC